MSTSVAAAAFVPLVCVCSAVLGLAVSVPPQRELGADVAAAGGLSAVFWSVLDDCFGGEDAAGSATVCLKHKALTALDRALAKPALAIADGVSLTARAGGKSLTADGPSRAVHADLAALDAAREPGRKNALLDDMLASRLDEFVSTRTVVMDGEQGRGKKKDKTLKQAIMMASMVAAAVMGPMAFSVISFIAIKALLVSKIALILSGIMTIKKLMSQKQKNSHETEPMAIHYARNMLLNAHDMVYSEQKQ